MRITRSWHISARSVSPCWWVVIPMHPSADLYQWGKWHGGCLRITRKTQGRLIVATFPVIYIVPVRSFNWCLRSQDRDLRSFDGKLRSDRTETRTHHSRWRTLHSTWTVGCTAPAIKGSDFVYRFIGWAVGCIKPNRKRYPSFYQSHSGRYRRFLRRLSPGQLT